MIKILILNKSIINKNIRVKLKESWALSQERYEKWNLKLISGNSEYFNSKQTRINRSRVEQSKFPNIPTTGELLQDKQV